MSGEPPRALTLQRPWGLGVVRGLKTIENRSWRPAEVGGTIVVHSGKAWDPRAARWFPETFGHLNDRDVPTGFVGTVRLVVVCSAGFYDDPCDCGPFAMRGLYHWVLDRPREFDDPLPGKGQLGFFTPSRQALAVAHLARWV